MRMNSCVYFLLCRKKIVYVGHTSYLSGRIKTHKSNKEFDQVKYIETDYFFGAKMERFFIAYLKPKYNSRIDWKDFEVKDFDMNRTALKKVSKYKEELV